VPMLGAPATTALTVKLWLTCAAGKYTPLPASSALIVQVPVVTKAKVPPLVMVHTPAVDEVNTGAKPESDVAVRVGVAPKLWLPGFAKVIVCAAIGVTLFDALEAEPVPTELVAVTLKL
jgi:hypothetical protein